MPPGEGRPAGLDASSLTASLGFLMRLSQQAMFEEFHRRAGPFGITPARFSLLCLVRDNPGSPMADLAAALYVKPSNFAVLVQEMQKDGLVIRRVDAADRRRSLLDLSPAGQALLGALAPEIDDMEAGFEARLGSGLHRSLKTALARLTGSTT